MDSEQAPPIPVPFSVDELPESLQPFVRSALRDALHSQEAYRSIEEYWDDDGERTSTLLLAYAFLRLVDACEVMVDRQMEAADLALELTQEAKRRGVDERNDVVEFEQTSREIYGNAKDRRDYWYKMGGFDPSELHDDELLPVASEFLERGESERALPFYRQAIQFEAESPTEDWLDFGRCLEAVGEDGEAQNLYRRIVSRRDEVDETLVLSAYAGLVIVAPDADAHHWFEQARTWAETIDADWPWGYTSQEAVLGRARRLDDGEMATHVADVISSREGVVPREVREMIEEVRERY